MLSESENKIQFIETFCKIAGVNTIGTKNLLLKCILPIFCCFSFESRKKLLIFASKEELLSHFEDVTFIRNKAKNIFECPKKFYLGTEELFKLCFPDQLLPGCWAKNDKIFKILVILGLNIQPTIAILLEISLKIEQRIYTELNIIKETINSLSLLSQLPNDKIDENSLKKIANINFLQVWNATSINGLECEKKCKWGNFASAQLNSFSYICATTCWIHLPAISTINPCYYEILNIPLKPKPASVLKHLNNLLQLCKESIFPDSKFFYRTYSHIEENKLDVTSLKGTPCIFYKNSLYNPINMIKKFAHDLSPYLFQIPPELTPNSNFLFSIGVMDQPDENHFSNVLSMIHSEENSNLNECSDEIKKIAILAFEFLIEHLITTQPNKHIKTFVLTAELRIVESSIAVYADNTQLLSKIKKVIAIIPFNILRTLKADEYGSCEPPQCLKIQKLSEKVQQQLSNKNYKNSDQTFATEIAEMLNCPLIHRALIRIYHHDTKQRLSHLKWLNGEMISKQSHPNQFESDLRYKNMFEIFFNLEIEAWAQIDIDLTIEQKTYSLPDAYNCYIPTEQNNLLLIKEDPNPNNQSLEFWFDFVHVIDSLFSKIFSKTLNFINLCFTLPSDIIMDKLDDYNISPCPEEFLEDIPLPIVLPNASPSTKRQIRHHGYSRPSHPKMETRTLAGPDEAAAKLWIRTAQWDLLAAKRLMGETLDSQFPSHSCFMCFESVFKAFIAVICLFDGQRMDLINERNLLSLVEEQFPKSTFFNNEAQETFLSFTMPLMSLDAPTRLPCSTPGVGTLIPRQYFVPDTAKISIQLAESILNLLFNTIPNLRDISIAEGTFDYEIEPSHLIEELENHIPPRVARKILSEESEEFMAAARRFFTTLPKCAIISIEKITSYTCWMNFNREINTRVGNIPNRHIIRTLFHGSGNTCPSLIINSDVGFDIRYASNGLWGYGIYFADDSSYAKRYQYDVPGRSGVSCMFLASVFVGYSHYEEQNRQLRGPPQGFDSVNGIVNNAKVYTIYNNSLAYPTYLITYSAQ